MNVKTMLEYAEAHGRAIRDGNMECAQADVSPEFNDNGLMATLPHPVTAYEVVSVTVTAGVGTVQIRYSGTGPTHIIESDWEVRGNRPILFQARSLQTVERAGVKMVGMFRRKDGLTPAEFRDYYESRHVPLITSLLRPYMSDYRRNFSEEGRTFDSPHVVPELGGVPMFDVLTELTFESEEQFQAMVAALSNPEIGERIARDEEQFIDRASMRSIFVDERRS